MSNGWRQVSLEECYELIDARLAPTQLDSARPYVGLEHLQTEKRHIDAFGAVTGVRSMVTPFQPGDVLFGRLRPYLRKVALASVHGVCSPEILVLRPILSRCSSEYLMALVSSETVIERCIATSAGSRMPRTSARDLGSVRISLPSLREQSRIVKLFTAVNNVATALDQTAFRTREALAAVRYAAAANSKQMPLGSLCAPDGVQIGPFGSQLHAHEYQGVGIPVVMPQDMIDGEIVTRRIARVSEFTADRLARHRLAPGDIVLPRRGDLTKRALVTKEQSGWLCGTGSVRIRVSPPVRPDVVFHLLSTQETNDWLAVNAVGTTMPNLNTQIVRKLPVPLPIESELEGIANTCGALMVHWLSADAVRASRSRVEVGAPQRVAWREQAG